MPRQVRRLRDLVYPYVGEYAAELPDGQSGAECIPTQAGEVDDQNALSPLNDRSYVPVEGRREERGGLVKVR